MFVSDEATSALDATSRVLVFEAIKRWRTNKTTIVITHDLSQIGSSDFVYVLKNGHVVEQGYRYDLESSHGEFREMMETQGATGGFLPEKEIDDQPGTDEVEAILEEEAEKEKQELDAVAEDTTLRPFNLKHQSLARPALRPVTLGNWMFDAVAELTKNGPTTTPAPAMVGAREPHRLSRFIPAEAFAKETSTYQRRRRPSSVTIPSVPLPPATYTVATRRYSLQFTPTSPEFSFHNSASMTSTSMLVEDDNDFDMEKSALQRSGSQATSRRRVQQPKPRTRWDDAKLTSLTTVKVAKSGSDADNKDAEKQQPFWALLREIYPTVPYKPIVFLGLVICLFSGAMTPVFSFLLSRLLFEVSIGAKDTATINKYGGIVLGVAAFDGLLMGFKYFIMETSALCWVTRIRKSCFKLLLSQDKKWFDKSENSPVRMVQVLIKDGDDARNLIAVVLGQCLVVVAMFGVGLIWALVRGWQLTLVGFAIAPVFAATMALQTNLVSKCELRNKRAREEVAKGYYEVRLLFFAPSSAENLTIFSIGYF